MLSLDRRGLLLGAGAALPMLAGFPALAQAADPQLEAAIASDLRPPADKAATSGAIRRPRSSSGG